VILEGGCHCGAFRAALETDDPGALQVRACQCGFCRRHAARTVSDPDGTLRLSFSEAAVTRYRFGLKSADFLICKGCGDYMAAVMDSVGIVNVVAADIAVLAEREPDPMVYENETLDAKRQRRLSKWSPVVMEVRP
jgi:hypothetical protein